MYQYIPMAIASVVGLVIGKNIAKSSKSLPAFGRRLFQKDEQSVEILNEQFLNEESFILATEEIPLDNRFGNRVLVSEHEFSRTAKVSLDLERTREFGSSVRGGVWSLLTTQLSGELGRTLGIAIGSQITRRVRLKFEVDPGQSNRYLVVWKQKGRRGIVEICILGKRKWKVPYLITYDLSHTIESLENVETTKSLNSEPKG
ncbi:MAG: hypothetical protein H7832_03855 [Magnetococcus sp. DMHC-6]